MKFLYLIVPLAPLAGALVAGLLGWLIGRRASHVVTIAGMVVSVLASFLVFRDVLAGNTFNGPLYTWITSGDFTLQLGFLIDKLSATMMLVVTFVSLMVHVYTIGYMADDPGYQRFFSYISLFTFSRPTSAAISAKCRSTATPAFRGMNWAWKSSPSGRA